MIWNRFSLSLIATTALSAGLGLAPPAQAADEEIIVTARRVEERLQDVPISIAVFNQKQLESRNIITGQDLATYTPNLAVSNQFGANNSSFAIRGFVQEAHTTASVGAYFAEVVAPRGGNSTLGGGNEGPSAGNLWDLENVQVLRGPQGTLFGRNTTGGAVILVPVKPKSQFGGYVEGSYGNFDMKRLQAVLNVPLGTKARLRVGFDRQTRDGYLDNVGTVGPKHLGNVDRISGRASLVVDITPDLENYTIVTLTNSDGTATEPALYDANPNKALPEVLASLAKIKAAHDFYATINNFHNPGDFLQSWQGINTTTWHASDLLTLKNIASYSVIQQDTFYNAFGADILLYAAGPLANYHSVDQYNITEELQLQGRSANNRLSWQVGLYYEQSNPRADSGASAVAGLDFSCTDITRPATSCTGVGLLIANTSYVRYRDMAAYTQATYALLDNLKLTAGLRFTHDEVKGGEDLSTQSLDLNGTIVPDTSATKFPNSRGRTTGDAPTWLLDLEWNPTPDMLTYVKYARGYRQGSYVPQTDPPSLRTFLPEFVESYEVGAKSTFHGKVRGTVNLAVFYNDFSQQQLDNSVLGLPGTSEAGFQSSTILNAGQSSIWGVELESSLHPFRSFRLDASAAYLATKLSSAQQPPFDPTLFLVAPKQDVGGDLSYSPKWKATVTGTYTLPLPDSIGLVDFGVTYAFNSGYTTMAPSASPWFKTDRTNLVNLNLNWLNMLGGPVDASFFVTNLLDETYVTSFFSLYNQPSVGTVVRQLGQPRMFGARLKLRFGADAQ